MMSRTEWLKARGFALVLVCLLLDIVSVHAASLGNIDVKSKLYEPFHAQIVLRGVSEGELEGMRVSLADETAFERAGLPRPFLLSTLKFNVVTTGARSGYVKITSHERIREPSLSFVIDAAFAGRDGTLQRRYDVLLDLN